MTRQRGKLVVISSPSGGGKTSVAMGILKKYPDRVARAVTDILGPVTVTSAPSISSSAKDTTSARSDR